MAALLTTSDRLYRCPACEQEWKTSHGLARHFEACLDHKTAASLLLSIVRTGIYLCPVCGKAGRYDPESPPGWHPAGWAHPECREDRMET